MYKKVILTFGVIATSFGVFGQTAPYALTPIWIFGSNGKFDFTGGGATPAQPARPAGDDIIAFEGSGTLCAPDKTVMVYDNNVRVGGNNGVPVNTPYMAGSTSSTQGGIILPDPSNLTGGFFAVTGNAESVYWTEPLDAASQGVRVYRGTKNGGSVTLNGTAVATLVAGNNSLEQLAAGSDGAYGYWVIHERGAFYANGDPNFYSTRISSTGTVTANSTNSSYSTSGNWGMQAQGSIKISRCQTRIAIAQATSIAVFNWDRTTGQIGTALKYVTGVNVGGGSKLYGCEFSPNGRYLYASTLGGSDLIVLDVEATGGLTTGLSYKTGQTASGSLQLAPNNTIYVANGLDGSNSTTVGTITNADGGGNYTRNALALSNSAYVRLGISNIPFLNPQRPTITRTNPSCGKYTYTLDFDTHFNDAISLDSARWEFSDGTKIVNYGANVRNSVTRDYTTTTSKTVTLTLTDAVCKQKWTATNSVTPTCVLPVDFISFGGKAISTSAVKLNWVTATEKDNSHFDVQRSSDGINYKTIGSQKGNGNAWSTTYYTFTDDNAPSGLSYYRLIQYDLDGKNTPSKVIAVRTEESAKSMILVAPNPFQNDLTLVVNNTSDQQSVAIYIYDTYGNLHESLHVDDTTQPVKIGAGLTKGTYILEVVGLEETFHQKIIKE